LCTIESDGPVDITNSINDVKKLLRDPFYLITYYDLRYQHDYSPVP
jgi:hypothetical protein